MKTYSDQQLEVLMQDLESDLVERKESLKGDLAKKARQAVCGFANDLPDHRRAGVLFVGVDDRGKPNGLAITDDLLLLMADFKADGGMVPPPSVVVEKRRLCGFDIAVAHVQPAESPPVRRRGDAGARAGAAIWLWDPDRAGRAAEGRPPAAGVRGRCELGSLHGPGEGVNSLSGQ